MADFFSIVTFGKRRRLDILSWGPSCSKPADLCRLGSNFSLGFFFFCWREFSRIICPILENCRQKEWKLIRFLTFHMWTQFSYSFLYPTFNSPALIISVIYYYYFFCGRGGRRRCVKTIRDVHKWDNGVDVLKEWFQWSISVLRKEQAASRTTLKWLWNDKHADTVNFVITSRESQREIRNDTEKKKKNNSLLVG